jgi:hypothetical protein
MDIVLATMSKNKLYKVGTNKIFALLTFLTIEFFINIVIFSIIFFSLTGFNSWSSQVQIKYFTSIYNMTFGSAYLLFIFMGWLSIMTIGSMVAVINSFLQKSHISLVLGFIISFFPLIINILDVFPTYIKKFFLVQPVNGFIIERWISSIHIYKFVSVEVLSATATIINSFVLLLICLFIAPRLFRMRISKI